LPTRQCRHEARPATPRLVRIAPGPPESGGDKGGSAPPLLLSATLRDAVPPALEKNVLALLPSEQAASIAGNRREQDRSLRILVRLLLAEGLRLLEGRSFPDSLGRLARTARGRPFVRDSGWECSFSHSGDLALCLLGRRTWHGRLGIDAERMRPLALEDVAAAF
jgi:phosphopantetheinyl transferase